jgi:import inner membrane translocase subunit TIM50
LTKPYSDRLLPDQLPIDLKKKTLIINLTGTLIDHSYKLYTGFEILKRPNVIKFLNELGQFYEIVVFGTEDSTFVEEICQKLDKGEMNIRHKLGKEATCYENGKYVKDLRYINRNMRNVIVIDYDIENLNHDSYNTIILPKFSGDIYDQELLNIIPFLKEMAKPSVTDVRKEIEKLGNYRSHIKFYKLNKKYHQLVPPEV